MHAIRQAQKLTIAPLPALVNVYRTELCKCFAIYLREKSWQSYYEYHLLESLVSIRDMRHYVNVRTSFILI
jgi:hypothetical protein